VHGYKPEANILFFTGGGANGKSTLSALCSAAFGDYFYAPDVKIFTCKRTSSSAASPDIAGTKGKRLVWASEPEETDKFQVGVLKNWSGGDKVQARELFKDCIEFMTQFQIAIAMNHLTGLSATDGGIGRRTRILNFPMMFCDNPIPNTNQRQVVDRLQNKFETDTLYGEHFMNMLVERYVTRIHEKKIHVPQEVKQLSQDYLDENNALKKFLNDCVDVTGDDSDMVLSTDLYYTFKGTEYYTSGNDMKWFVRKMGAEGLPSTRQTSRKLPFYTKQVFKKLKLKQNDFIEVTDELE
jgi:P4 family phage/plasmid primase-like protien